MADSALCFETMEKIILDAIVSPDVPVQVDEHQKPWQSKEIQELIRKRRLCINSRERAFISKQIQKSTRRILRKYQNEKTSKLLGKFTGLSDLHRIPEYPIKRKIQNT